MSVKERIILFVKHKRITATAFCESIGVSKAFISSMRTSLQPDKIKSISLHYPELNIDWLITGEGQMIKQGYVSKSILQTALPDEILNTSDMNCPHCKYKDELIEELRNRLNDKERLIIEKDQVINLLLKTPGTINKSAI